MGQAGAVAQRVRLVAGWSGRVNQKAPNFVSTLMAKSWEASFEAAFTDLFRRSELLALRILGDEASAEDVAAEALARAYARWPTVGELAWREGWVLRVTTNLAIDAARVRRRPLRRPVGEHTVDGAEAVAVRLALVAALGALPRRQREAVALRYLADLGEAETASALGISTGTVKTHLHRGVETLRSRLGATFQEDHFALE